MNSMVIRNYELLDTNVYTNMQSNGQNDYPQTPLDQHNHIKAMNVKMSSKVLNSNI